MSGSAVVAEAEKFLGYPYSYTGASPATGFSCIGFVSYVYHQLGVNMPGDLGDAMAAYPHVPESALEPGDIVFFQNTWWPGVSHVAIYIGNGQVIHAENPRRGVAISSISNDPQEGNYWQQHYLVAERPWGSVSVTGQPTTGAPTSPPPGVGVPAPPGTAAPTSTVVHRQVSVVVPSLNVRSAPSLSTQVITVVAEGTTLGVLGHVPGWVHVQLPDSTVGWVVRAGIHRVGGAGGATPAPVAPTSSSSPTAPPSPVGRVQGPSKLVTPKKVVRTAPVVTWRLTTLVRVNGLRVHSQPAMTAPVIATLMAGQRVGVLGRVTGWLKVGVTKRLVGWVLSQYTAAGTSRSGTASGSKPAPAAPTAPRTPFRGGVSVVAGVRIHSAPSLTASVIATTVAGMKVHVRGYSNGFVHVQTSTGVVGWIAAQFVGGRAPAVPVHKTATAPVHKTTTHRTPAAGTHVVATVRLHTGPSLTSRVIGVVPAGTRVSVLRSTAGWDFVRVATGSSGYVSAQFVAA